MFAVRSSVRVVARHTRMRAGASAWRPLSSRAAVVPQAWAQQGREAKRGHKNGWRPLFTSRAVREESTPQPEAVSQKELAVRVGERLQKVVQDERLMGQLATIRAMKEGHVMQWQYLIGNMQQTMDACIAEVFQAAGLPPPANFPEFLYRAVKEGGPEVRELHGSCWAAFIDAAFGPELLEGGEENAKTAFTLTEARRYVSELVEIFTSSQVLDGMQEAMLKPDWNDMQFRMHCVHEVLLPPHLKLLKKFGFHGEKGYVLAQRSLLVDHMPDRSILDSSSALSHIVVKYVQQEAPSAGQEAPAEQK